MTDTNKTPPHKASQPDMPPAGSTRKPAARTSRNDTAGPDSDKGTLAPHEREQVIAAAAYFRAQQRGFIPGGELEDWLQAEAEVDRFLLGAQSSVSGKPRNKPQPR